MIKQAAARILAGFQDFFKSTWQHKSGRVLLSAAGVLLLVAAGLGIGLYLEGITAGHNSQALLGKYEQSASTAALENTALGSSENSADNNVQTAGFDTPKTIDGYSVIGTLTLEKTSQTLPVILDYSEKALKVSVCWYKGAQPGEMGNMVITGHDYASGAHFGRLAELTEGDRVTFAAPDRTYVYEVYETEIIRPDQPEKLDDYQGPTALTLLTCTSHGNRRLVVRCKLTP